MKGQFIVWVTIVLVAFKVDGQEYVKLESDIDKLVLPLLETNNFSGTILVSKDDAVVFEKAYGKMNREYGIDNRLDTKFFLASVSMIFTSAAIMKLHEEEKLSIHDTLTKFYPDYKNGHLITLEHMLAQRSGIPAIGHGGNVDYNRMTKFTHSTEELMEYFMDYDLLFEPGEKYNHGRSEYILLANIIEKVSGKSFGNYLRDEIFVPLSMNDTGHYQSEKQIISSLAKGYAPKGLYDVESAYQIDWSSKTGHASIFSTVSDLQKFGQAYLDTNLLGRESWERIFTDYGSEVGYGWFIRPHLEHERYQMNGRSPGFSSYFAIYPDDDLMILVLSNNYISLPADMGMTIAAMVLEKPYEFLNLSNKQLDAGFAQTITGTYKFDENFYVPNYELKVEQNNGYLTCEWGDLIPVDKGEENIRDFILRTYWSSIRFVNDGTGKVAKMEFDRYSGIKIK